MGFQQVVHSIIPDASERFEIHFATLEEKGRTSK